jgi:hypothetical protein
MTGFCAENASERQLYPGVSGRVAVTGRKTYSVSVPEELTNIHPVRRAPPNGIVPVPDSPASASVSNSHDSPVIYR